MFGGGELERRSLASRSGMFLSAAIDLIAFSWRKAGQVFEMGRWLPLQLTQHGAEFKFGQMSFARSCFFPTASVTFGMTFALRRNVVEHKTGKADLDGSKPRSDWVADLKKRNELWAHASLKFNIN